MTRGNRPAPDDAAWGYYAALHPNALERILDESPVAYLPWGALDWHGPHLPFGVAGFTAEAICERVARRAGGVILPTTWWPITAVPHHFSISLPSHVVLALWDALFAELMRLGVQLAVVATGHYAHAHDLLLMDAAETAMERYGIMVLAIPPMALVDDQMLDHAAHWEVAQMLAIRPRLVDVAALGEGPLPPAITGVLGNDPRAATPSQGESALVLATESLVGAVRALLENHSHASIRELYARRRRVYQRYVETYFRGSWEEAAQAWWADRTRPSAE
ncbi:creatininase family protein [Chloroflexia bacterium SDU3-3]|nr:creatininase family protein [Chloroflexia bacterium SDU3-3]